MSQDKKTQTHVLLLTPSSSSHAANRLRQAGEKLGITVRTGDPARCLLDVGSGEPRVRLNGRKIPPPAAVIPRFGPGHYEHGLATVHQFEMAGVAVCNSRQSIDLARDTFRSLLEFDRAGLKVPRTARILTLKDLRVARKIIPGPPWILKTFTGAMGIGTMVIRQSDQLEAVAATLWALGQPILMQQFIPMPEGQITDFRAIVIGDRVIGGIRRKAMKGEIRTNVHRGGIPEPYPLSSQDIELALRAARAIGLRVAGVDWMTTDHGRVLLEVNATPGFQGFELATGVDVATEMLEFAISLGDKHTTPHNATHAPPLQRVGEGAKRRGDPGNRRQSP